MRYYNPLSWFRKYESKEKPEASEREQSRSKLKKIVEETRVLLKYAASVRCLMYNDRTCLFPLKSYASLDKKQ